MKPLKEEFEGYKTEQTKKESHAAKEKAYRALLQEAGVSEKRLESVLKVSDVDSVELDERGPSRALTSSRKVSRASGRTLSPLRRPEGTDLQSPGKTKADIYKKDEHGRYVLSAAERQKALVENQIT